MIENMIKALKCMGSHDHNDDCFMERYNTKAEKDGKPCVVCEKEDAICGKEGVVQCPYYQDEYDCSFNEGKSYWLGEVAEILEEGEKE